MPNSTGKSIIKDLTKFSESDETNYQLQSRLSTYYQNNPSNILLFSQEYSNEEDASGNKIPLGGEVNEYLNNINNAPSQDKSVKALYSNEFPFWEFNCKGQINNKVTEVKKEEETEVTEEFGNEEFGNEEFGNEETKTDVTEITEKFGNEETEKKTNLGKIIGTILLILFIIIIVLIILNKYDVIDFLVFAELLNMFN
tara:strand:+ start:463 stop:1056 length:594 start_codon:yes stop_codon:yes gene_type:complete